MANVRIGFTAVLQNCCGFVIPIDRTANTTAKLRVPTRRPATPDATALTHRPGSINRTNINVVLAAALEIIADGWARAASRRPGPGPAAPAPRRSVAAGYWRRSGARR